MGNPYGEKLQNRIHRGKEPTVKSKKGKQEKKEKKAQ